MPDENFSLETFAREFGAKFDTFSDGVDARLKVLETKREAPVETTEKQFGEFMEEFRQFGLKLENFAKVRQFSNPAGSNPADNADAKRRELEAKEKGTKKDFAAIVADHMTKNPSLSKVAAITAMSAAHPELHREYVQGGGSRTL